MHKPNLNLIKRDMIEYVLWMKDHPIMWAAVSMCGFVGATVIHRCFLSDDYHLYERPTKGETNNG